MDSLSELPFFEDRVGERTLPSRPSNVCQSCWEGPFAVQFGLPCGPVSMKESRHGYDTKSHTYSTSSAELKSRAIAGCIWCQFITVRLAIYAETDGPRSITISANRDRATGTQTLEVSIPGERALCKGFVHADSDNPAASVIALQTPIPDVGSSRSLALAKRCIQQCIREHKNCQALFTSSSDHFLPTRLVDCHDPAKPRLVSIAHDQHALYVALSYVWGEDVDQPHKTTTTNLPEYGREIQASCLPQTIQDAIHVTHALGFQFLWADTLCIIQDLDEDMRHELGHMHHIYRYASLTIIAASAGTVSEGFLHDRRAPPQFKFGSCLRTSANGDLTLPFICYSRPATPESAEDLSHHATTTQIGTVHITPFEINGNDISKEGDYYSWPFSDEFISGPIATRGWCMQEHLLSPRSLVFGNTTLQLRCQAAVENVGDPTRRPTRSSSPSFSSNYSSPHSMSSWPILITPFLPHPPLAKHVLEVWRKTVHDYSGRALSEPSDKLVACAAVAEYTHQVLRWGYLAGLWDDMLLSDLLWRRRLWDASIHRPRVYRAPSWSWAAVDGEVFWYDQCVSKEQQDADAVAKVVDCNVTLEVAALPFGRVTGGSLILCAALFQCRLWRRSEGSWSSESLAGECQIVLQSGKQPWVQRKCGDLDGSEEDDAEVRLVGDAIIDYHTHDGHIDELWAVPLLAPSEAQGNGMSGLVVALVDSNSSEEAIRAELVYRRLGYFHKLGHRRRKPGKEENLKDSRMSSEFHELVQALKTGEYPMVDITLV